MNETLNHFLQDVLEHCGITTLLKFQALQYKYKMSYAVTT